MKCKKMFLMICAILLIMNMFFMNPVLALTDLQKKAADLNGDGKITKDDLNLMLDIGYPKRPKDGIEGDENSNYIMDDLKNASNGGFSGNPGSVGNWCVIWDNSYTKKDFNKMVKNFTPPDKKGNSERGYIEYYKKYFVKNADNFFDICTKYNIDPRFIFAIGLNESQYGTSNIANTKGNFFGWGAYDDSPMESAITFGDMSKGIEDVAKGLANNYISPNGTWYNWIKEKGFDPTTVDGIGSRYASDTGWADNVKYFMTKVFGYAGGGSGSGAAGSGSSSATSGDGYTQVYRVGDKTYKEFKQGQGTYAHSVKYSEGDIASSGCGPTSATIVASGYGKDFNPGTLVEAARQKYGVSNFKASPDATGKMLTTAGLAYTQVWSISAEQLKSHLGSGRPIVMSVSNACGGLFTNASHYIAILDVKGEQAYVSNPSRKATGWIDISKIVICNSGHAAFLIN